MLTARIAVALIVALAFFPGAYRGPSSSETPYVVPLQRDVAIVSVLTAGDSSDLGPGGQPYRLVGLPDGLGALDNMDGTFTLLVNHEIGAGSGGVRRHRARGAFISKWTIRKSDLRVLWGEDLIHRVSLWDPIRLRHAAPVAGVEMSRFCSGDLAHQSAWFDPVSGLGYAAPIYMNGEESEGGRAFAHMLDGTSFELPRMGRFRIENEVARPGAGEKTVVVGLDDTDPAGQVYVYIGRKTGSGLPVDRAGLTNGRLYGVKVTGYPNEIHESGIPSGTPFTLHEIEAADRMSAPLLEGASNVAGVTLFWRPEDGAWDPKEPRDFYFATTATFAGKSRLWRLRFADVDTPEAGGTIEMLLTGTEGPRSMDNVTVTRRGEVIVQEDPGGALRLARIWRYVPATGELTALAEHDPVRFGGAPGGLTVGEESSGVIDVSSILGEGWLLFDVQARHPLDSELVEGGQLLAMRHSAPRRRAVR